MIAQSPKFCVALIALLFVAVVFVRELVNFDQMVGSFLAISVKNVEARRQTKSALLGGEIFLASPNPHTKIFWNPWFSGVARA